MQHRFFHDHHASSVTILIIIAAVVLTISGCGTSKGGSITCKTNTDCANLQSACSQAACSQGTCKVTTSPNCCGNLKCDTNETKCSCPLDCGTCKGDVLIPDSKGKKVNSTNLQIMCDSKNQCGPGYDISSVREKQFFNEFIGPGFKINIYLSYDQPLDVAGNPAAVELSLMDIDTSSIDPPITISEIRMLEGTKIIGRQPSTISLSNIGDSGKEPVGISYQLTYPEEQKSVTIQIDYAYNPIKTDSKGKITPLAPVRKTYSFSVPDKITIVDPTIAS